MSLKQWKRLPRKLKKKLGIKAKQYLIDHNNDIYIMDYRRSQTRMENFIGYNNYWNITPPNIRGTGR